MITKGWIWSIKPVVYQGKNLMKVEIAQNVNDDKALLIFKGELVDVIDDHCIGDVIEVVYMFRILNNSLGEIVDIPYVYKEVQELIENDYDRFERAKAIRESATKMMEENNLEKTNRRTKNV